MRKNDMGFKQAITLLRNKRKSVCPNLGFEMQLKKYEVELQKKTQKGQKEPKVI